MSLVDLQQTFNQQRTQNAGKVSIDATTLQNAKLTPDENLDVLLQGYLMVSGTLAVQTKGAIPAPVNNQLSFSGTAVFLEPTHPVNPNGPKPPVPQPKPVTLAFTVDDASSSQVHLLITSQPPGWTFQSSFPWLPDYPFKKLSLTKNTLLFSSCGLEAYAWQGTKIDLQTGLNFASLLKNDGPLAILSFVLKGAADTLTFSGTIDPRKITPLKECETVTPAKIVLFPQINLAASLTKSTVGLPWFNLKMAAPQVVLQTVNDAYGQSFWLSLSLTLTINGKQQIVQSAMLENWNQFCFGLTAADQSQSLTINDIKALAGGNDFKQTIPDVLKTAFESVGLRGINTTFFIGKKPTLSSVNLAIGATKPWQLTEKFTIKDIVLQFFLFNPASKPKPDAVSFSATMAFFYPKPFPGDFIMELQHQVSSKITTISGRYEGEVTLDNILKGMSDATVTLPKNFKKDVTFSDFGVSFTKASNQWTYQFYGSAKIAFKLNILNGNLESSFSINVNKTAQGKVFSLNGGLAIGDAYFSFTLNLSSQQKLMEANWYQQGGPLGLNSIAKSLGFEDFFIPEDLDIALVSASFSYDFKNEVFVLTAKSKNYGDVSVSSVNIPNLDKPGPKTLKSTISLPDKWQAGVQKKQEIVDLETNSGQMEKALIFFCHLKGTLSAKSLPLVGEEIGNYLTFSNLEFLLSSADFESVTVPLPSTSKGPGTNPSITLNNVKRGVTFSSDLKLGTETQKITVPIYHPKSKKQTLLLPETTSVTPAQPANLGGATSVGKSLGPFNFKNFGVSFKNKHLFFELDASMITAGLQIHLNGLGLGFSATGDFSDVQGKLDGLAVAFQGGPVSISGGLIHNESPATSPESYDGQVTVKLTKLMIAALGSYAKVEGGPSLFVFAVIDFPLGGPPFFFVTGGAIGFGYNRDLIIPGINGVRNFPLIQAAFGQGGFKKGDLSNNLEKMLPVIPPKSGQNWLGLGVKFRSFNLIDGFVLITLNFGNYTEANVLGLATTIIPFGATKNPIAYAELALLARFLPDKGVVSIEGALTDRSFILSEKCKLTGGFAFYLWFKGEQAGDFVLTFGGYHPNFKIPAHYPKPARIELYWQVTDQLSITGQSYFALTPSCIMAGGGLNCNWHSGPLRAWFMMQTDLLIAWQPFHYDIHAAINIGVSLRIKVWFVHKTIEVKVWAGIHIWGPDFSGNVKIELWFVSFTISFGAGSQKIPPPISWKAFKQACLPEPIQNNALPTVAEESGAVCSIQVNQGLIKELSQDETATDWTVNAADFELEVATLIPAKKVKFGTSKVTSFAAHNTDFGVGLVQVEQGDFTSELTITITKEGESAPLPQSDFILEPVLKNVPSSMWTCREKPSMDSEMISNTLAGFTIQTKTHEPDSTLAVPLEHLLLGNGTPLHEIEYTTPKIPTSDSFDQSEAMAKMMGTIDVSPASTSRTNILDCLVNSNYDINETVEVEDLSTEADQYWFSGPTLSYLGEEKL